MNFANNYMKIALVYLVIGIALGTYMAMTLDYTHRVSHVHILMMGFIIQAIYGLIHKTWFKDKSPALSNQQFTFHQVGTILLVIGFICIFGGYLPPAIAGITAGVGAICSLIAAIYMLFMIKRAK